MEGGEQCFDWSALAPRIVHPLKVTIVEALLWIGRPLSASDLRELLDNDRYGVSHLSYHLVKLADAEGLEVMWSPEVAGVRERLYFLR